MAYLHSDPNFHYEAIRALGIAPYYGGDIKEILNILPKIKPGDFEDWYREWYNLARRVLSTIDESKPQLYSPVTLRDVYFRASRYFFVADFFLHGNSNDPRSDECFQLWRSYFDKANALLENPGQHATIATGHGFDVPVIIYKAPQATKDNPRPTLLVGGGFDSNYEELYHVFGVPALTRGYNVIVYEGPGQPVLLHKQKVGFIHDWEKAVSPIVDYVFKHSSDSLAFIDKFKIGLIGYSLGGYLSARAAAFEPRLAAVICIDGVWSVLDAWLSVFDGLKSAYQASDANAFNEIFDSTSTASSTNQRWFHDHTKFSFCKSDAYEIFKEIRKMTLDGIAHQINMPAFIGDADSDIFFLGQPGQVVQAIGSQATLFKFTAEQAADAHCQSGALIYLNQQILEWFSGVVGR